MTGRASDATRESGRTLAQEIIEAHGMKRWNRVSSLRVDVAFAGFAFRMKFLRNLPYRGTMVVERAVQRVTFESFPVPGTGACSRGRQCASSRLTAELFRVVLSHGRPFKTSGTGSGGTAWIFSILLAKPVGTISVFPSFSTTPRMNELEVDGTWRDGRETWRRLKVTFPPHIHTHCRQQVFLRRPRRTDPSNGLQSLPLARTNIINHHEELSPARSKGRCA
jgi:hypothetical protein